MYNEKCGSNCNYKKPNGNCGKLFGSCPMTTKPNDKVKKKNEERNDKNKKRGFKFF